MARRCNRRDFFLGRWHETEPRAETETSVGPSASSLPSDFSPALLRMEVARLGFDPDRLSAEEMEKLVKEAFEAKRPT